MVHGYFSNHSVNLCKELLNYTEVFDFTRCVRPDSTSYGTGGKYLFFLMKDGDRWVLNSNKVG